MTASSAAVATMPGETPAAVDPTDRCGTPRWRSTAHCASQVPVLVDTGCRTDEARDIGPRQGRLPDALA
ncbi:hypothetical protein OG426_47775 [Streptomyces canus]|uniref:hypothetical protein n=1 Tax=Streptomyces canus TaxID=58343 RepID=UPI00386C14A1|nr:hypothetical protein OG426_47775 [Streptomyces canus]